MSLEKNKNVHLMLDKMDFPNHGEGEPWLAHVAYADWTDGHNHVMHRHKDISEIFILLHGSGKYLIGGRLYDLRAGDIVLCNPDVMHDEFPDKCPVYDTLAIGIRGLALPGLKPGQLIGAARIPVLRRSSRTEDLRDLCLLIMKYASPGPLRNPRLIHRLLLAALDLLKDLVRQAEATEQEIDPLCVAVEQYLNDHFGEDVSLEETAKRFFVSTWHLSRLFKRETSYNFKQYLLRLRLGEAQVRLTVTDDSIGDIALACGFHDPAYFTRLFSRHIGLPPSRYRQLRTANRE